MEEILTKLPFWDKLTKPEQDLVLSSAVIQKYDAGQMIHTCDKQCVGLVYVISGNVRLYLLSEEGREVTLFHVLAGDTCVISASCVMEQISFHNELSAEEKTEILIIPAAVFGRIIKDNIYVRCHMYEQTSKALSDSMWVIQQIIFKSIDARVASFLLEESDRTGSETLNITQETIATEINTAREVVARMLKRFAAEGYIQNQRGKIIITDADALEDIAG
ncbi:MAG: Crp/Fnr family transcriptional regulator [Oscillospiraceae bacterium]|nr:Crp/Fnr family transcriptional regulator [Oscillospiraceae bacterium]